MRFLFLSLLLQISSLAHSQNLVSNKDEILAANAEMKSATDDFFHCIETSKLENCTTVLLEKGTSDFKKFVIANILFGIDPVQSLKLHKEVYKAKPESQDVLLEYAIELHRNGNFKEAGELYEKYMTQNADDFRVNVWLADCYINTGDNKKAIANWEQADHAKHHVSIDNAIYIIYGKSDQNTIRNNYRKEIEKGELSLFYPLIFLDMNWEFDWWNPGIQDEYLREDMALLEIKTGRTGFYYQTLLAYVSIKKLSLEENTGDSIKSVLAENQIVVGNNPLPLNGLITSDLLRICILNQLITEKEFFAKRGEELLQLAQATKDKEVLNIYAYLQGSAIGSVDPKIDKMGWVDYKDERFAISYLIGKGAQLKSDDKELEKALKDFPNSASLYRIMVSCASEEKKDMKPLLPELIRREFKTLATDPEHFSYALKSYFGFLKKGK